MPCPGDSNPARRAVGLGALRPWAQRFGIVVALAAICAALSVSTPSFLTVGNLVNVARQISINGILAVGVTFVLLTGGVDLSLGSVVALCGVVAATFAHPGDYPVCEYVAARTLALPFFTRMTDQQIDRVCQTLDSVLEQSLMGKRGRFSS